MGQSLSKIYIHLVFSTKGRFPLINEDIKPRLHNYRNKFHADHVHVLFRLSKNFPLAKVVEEVKKSSSKWAKAQGVQNFFWQNGYGAFSVSSSKIEVVRTYIRNQQTHHKTMTFQEEVVDFMKKYYMEDYNDEYFWR